MNKILLRTGRLGYSIPVVFRQAVVAHLSGSSYLREEQTLKGGGLDDDPSWEAGVLRHEKHLNLLICEGAKPEGLPNLDREEKVKDLPHLTHEKASAFQKYWSLLDETSNLLLGNMVKNTKRKRKAETATNLDPVFSRDDVQDVLQRIHYSCDLQKAYKHCVMERRTMPRIKYLTEKQLHEEMNRIRDEAVERLRMPPIMLQRRPCSEILAEDHVLEGYEEGNLSFVDISEGIKDGDRFMVIREPSGVLRTANWEERDRLTQTYYPKPHRKIIPPSFFEEDVIKNVFVHKLHENALDQCVAQFEADSAEYIRVFDAIFSDIDKQGLYGILRSTRYFGCLVYFLAKNLRLDGILLDMLNKDMLETAADCVALFALLHATSRTKRNAQGLSQNDHISIIQAYIKGDSTNVKDLRMALDRYHAAEKTSV